MIAKKGEEATLECVYTGPETVTSLTLEVEKEGSWTAVQTDTFITTVNQYVLRHSLTHYLLLFSTVSSLSNTILHP